MNNDQLSMLEVAIELMKQKKTPQSIVSIMKEVLELKGLDDPNGDYATQLYIDITTSSDFVYCGDGKWDLKARQSLDVFDLDGSFFNAGVTEEAEPSEKSSEASKVDDYNVEDDITADDDEDRDEDDEDDDYEDEEEIPYDEDYDPTDDDDEKDYLDEEQYNDYMDDYEDMYDDK